MENRRKPDFFHATSQMIQNPTPTHMYAIEKSCLRQDKHTIIVLNKSWPGAVVYGLDGIICLTNITLLSSNRLTRLPSQCKAILLKPIPATPRQGPPDIHRKADQTIITAYALQTPTTIIRILQYNQQTRLYIQHNIFRPIR